MAHAEVTFFGIEKGGRLSPPKTGFRPQIEMHGIHTSCVVDSLEGEELFLFERAHRVSLNLMFPEQYTDAFKIGDTVNLYEGSKLIGSGKIVL